jgi:hypothetical protein
MEKWKCSSKGLLFVVGRVTRISIHDCHWGDGMTLTVSVASGFNDLGEKW